MTAKNDITRLAHRAELSLTDYYRHREQRLVTMRAYREANKDKLNAARRAKHASDPDAGRQRKRDYIAANPEYRLSHARFCSEWHQRNRVEQLRKMATWRETNKETHLANSKRWRNENLERAKANLAAWRKANPDYASIRYHTEPELMLMRRQQARVQAAMRGAGAKRAGRTNELLGCDTMTLCAHIEAQFMSGMTWTNYGDWHLDHIRPICTFDLTDPEQQRECFHFTNLRPLWAKDNLSRPRRNWRPDDASTAGISA